MVRFHVKKGDESQFLYDTSIETTMKQIYEEITIIYNGRLKVARFCYEVEELSKHGPVLPSNMQGLAPGQAEDLKLTDEWADKCEASGGWSPNKDPMGKRNGRQPTEAMRDVLQRAVEEAKSLLSKKRVETELPLALADVSHALHTLRGAVLVVYPMGLPPYDPAKLEITDCEDLMNMQPDFPEFMDITETVLWFCGRQLPREKLLQDTIGKNNKTKAVLKLTGVGQGPPGREPVMSEQERLALMAHHHRKQQELEVGTAGEPPT